MSIETLTHLFLYCTIINFLFLALWAVLSLLPHAWVYRLVTRLCGVTAGQFDAINVGGMLLYKIAILIFNLAPWLALRILG